VVAASLAVPVSASWQSAAAGSQQLSTATLAPPTGTAAARGDCVPVLTIEVDVTWTATASTFADGYRVFRSATSGGPYTLVGTVSGRATTSFTDADVTFLTTYHYVVQATRNLWRSANSTQASFTTPTPACL
jgi:endoglucanase